MRQADLGTSALGWNMFARVWALVILRFIFGLWALAMLIWGMVIMNDRYVSGATMSPWWWWGAYLGHWAFFSLLIYYVIGFCFVVREIRTGAGGKMNCFEKWFWINYEIAWALMWTCALLFWIVIASDCSINHNCTQMTWYEYNVYAISIGTLLIELLFNLMRWMWLHFIFPLIFVIVWFIFAAIWHAASNVWLYAQQDDAVVGGGVAFGFYAVLIIVVVAFHMCGFGCGFLLEKCYKGKKRTTEGQLHGDDPVQLNDCCD